MRREPPHSGFHFDPPRIDPMLPVLVSAAIDLIALFGVIACIAAWCIGAHLPEIGQ